MSEEGGKGEVQALVVDNGSGMYNNWIVIVVVV
jgi:hypothetical protein